MHDISDYFEKIQRVMREKGVAELDVWNMDESGFRIGCGKAQLVVTMDPNKPLRMIDPENRDYITSIECICSAEVRPFRQCCWFPGSTFYISGVSTMIWMATL